MKTQNITVAQFIGQQIARSGRLQEEVAADCGFANRNIISMIKGGVTKLPLAKVGVLAKALDIDPAHLLRLVMLEYMPELWAAFEFILGRTSFVTEEEFDLLSLIRHHSQGISIDLSSIEDRYSISDAMSGIARRQLELLEASKSIP